MTIHKMGSSMRDEPNTKPADLTLQLEQAVRRYHALFERTNDAVFIIDLEDKHIKVNERAAEMLGYSVDELLRLASRDIIHPDEWSDAEEKRIAILTGENPPIYERTFKKKDGTFFPVEINVALIRDKDGHPLHFQSIVRDISVRKILEDGIRQSEERYRLLAEHVKDLIVTIDMDYNFTYVSPAVEQITGYSVEDALNLNLADILLSESFDIVNSAMQEALQLEKAVGPKGYDAPPIDIGLHHKDGGVIWAEVSRVFLRDERGQPIGVIGVLRDITRRKRVEDALQRSERRHRELIENNPEGIGIVDFEERFVFCNRALADLLGYEMSELVGMSILDLVSPEDKELIRSETSKRSKGISSTHQHEMKRKDGSSIIVRVSAVPWRNDEGEIAGAISVVTDITDRVRTQTELEITNRDLQLYTSLLRHDLRNDLQIILSQAEAAEILGVSDPKVNELCQATRYAANRMLQLIEIFKAPEESLSSNVLDLLESKAKSAEMTYQKMKVLLHLDGERSDFDIRRGRLIPALFDNLFRNSDSHAGPEVQIKIHVRKKGAKIEVDFIDDGPGISSEHRRNLFQRGDSTYQGGQGLYLCKQIAKAYKGDIELISTESGTHFRITLPAA